MIKYTANKFHKIRWFSQIRSHILYYTAIPASPIQLFLRLELDSAIQTRKSMFSLYTHNKVNIRFSTFLLGSGEVRAPKVIERRVDIDSAGMSLLLN